MDDVVLEDMAKWPNVPHCYGWLALDARGYWRMRDEYAQRHRLPGERIRHPALIAFINRNYTSDADGRWYFQNGPQRVYVSLEATPFIARTDPERGLVLHTGKPLGEIDSVFLSKDGTLIFQGDEFVAQLDDRDLSQCIGNLREAHDYSSTLEEQELLSWLEHASAQFPIKYTLNSHEVMVQFIARENLERIFQFQRTPLPNE